MRFVEDKFKFKTMRKEMEFIIYPIRDEKIILQADTRILSVNLEKKCAYISCHQACGAYLTHVLPAYGAKLIPLTDSECEKIKAMKDKMLQIQNPDGSITLGAIA